MFQRGCRANSIPGDCLQGRATLSPSACWVVGRSGSQAGVGVQQRSTAQPICPRAAVEMYELGSKHGLTFLGDDEKAAAAQGESFGNQTGTHSLTEVSRSYGRGYGQYWYRYMFMQLMKISRNELEKASQNEFDTSAPSPHCSASRTSPSSPTSVKTSPQPPRGGGGKSSRLRTSPHCKPDQLFPSSQGKSSCSLALANTKRRLPVPSLGGGRELSFWGSGCHGKKSVLSMVG